MDTRGNPSNLWIPYKESQLNINIDAFNMPRTGTTLCYPKIGYVDLMRNPALDTLALNSPLGHFNGDQRTPSLHHMDKNHGDSKTQSLTRPTTHAAISTFSTSHNSISSH